MQRASLRYQVSAGPRERPADGGAETMRKQGGEFERFGTRGRWVSTRDAFQARKDSKTMGFGGVLWVLSAAVGRKYPAGGT